MKFKSILVLYIALCIAFSGAVFAEGEATEASALYDDCADFQKAYKYSENLFAYVVPEEDYYAFDTDYTMFRRTSNTEEWLVYEIKEKAYPVFYTYFRYTDNIPHFKFEVSDDGENWEEIRPSLKIKDVENWKWIPVEYSIKNIDKKYVKVIYSDKSEYDWSPMISAVDFKMKTVDGGFYDCEGKPCEKSVEKLYALGFVSGVNEYEFCPENNVTRAEFAKINAGILDLPQKGRAEAVFNDVAPDYWAAAPIASLYRLGVVNGNENNDFNPESNVTYREAEKMLVVSLGYGIFAESQGGYPSGYQLVANRLNLSDGIRQKDKDAYVTRGDAAIMIDNAISAELIYQTAFGDNADFEKSDKTILDVYFDISTTEGLLSSANGKGITEGIFRKEDIAIVNGEEYVTEIDISNLLGMEIRAYIKDEKLIYAEGIGDKIRVSAADFVCIDDDKFIYTENGTEKSIKVSDDTRIVINGEYSTRLGLNPDLSNISGYFDILEEGETILVESIESYVSAGDFDLCDVITLKTYDTLKISWEDAIKPKLFLYGEEADYETARIKKNDVIHVAKSESGENLLVIVENNKVTGDVTYMDDEVVVVGGKEYKLSRKFNALNGELKVGSRGVVYPDINGNIFASESDSVFEYAYLLNVGEADVFDKKVKIRYLNKQGEIEEAYADDSTSLNGNKKSANLIENMSPQLIRVKKGKDGNLKAIDTANENLGSVGLSEFSLNYKNESGKYYGGNISAFGSIYQLGSTTPVFVIPEDIDDIKNYKVKDRSVFLTDREYSINIYDMSDEYRAGAVVLNMSGSSKRQVESYDNVAIIRRSSVIINAEGDKCLKLYVCIKGEEREVYFDNLGGEDMTNNWIPSYEARNTKDGNNPFSPGEVIQYYSDEESHCRSFRMFLTEEIFENEVLYENNLRDYGQITDENYFSELYTITGVVKERFADKLLVSAYSDGRRIRLIPTNGSVIYKFDKIRKELKIGDMTDISKNSYIFARMNYDSTVDIIVFE